MAELKYYVACSVDGFIAREDGSFDFALGEGDHLADLFREFPEAVPGHLRRQLGIDGPNRHWDVVLMGRATYEVGLDLGVKSPYPHMEQYLFSRTMERSPSEAVTLVSENALPLVRELKRREGRGIWLCGGGKLASALVEEIDELILKVNPVILGTGRPLFAGPAKERALTLVEHRTWENGFALLRYRTGPRTGNPPSA